MMAHKQIYLHRPRKTKEPKEAEAGSRTVLFEKINFSVEIILSSLVNTNFKTDILYPNSRDVVVYQTCAKLSKALFDKKMQVVRIFIFDKEYVKRIKSESKDGTNKKNLETAFRTKIHLDFYVYKSLGLILTGLIAIPESFKQEIINKLIIIRNHNVPEFLFDERIYNVGKEYKPFLRDFSNNDLIRESFVSGIIKNNYLLLSGKQERSAFIKKNKKWIS